MNGQKVILIFEIVLCILVLVGACLASHFIYADTYRISFVASFLTSWIVITLTNWKKEVNTARPKVRWFTILLVAITVVVFVTYKPELSYKKGKEIVTLQGYDNLVELEDRSVISFRLKHTRLVPNAYLYAGEKDNVKYYILLSPINGEIETERLGEGNYLDRYFEMKYGQTK